MRAAGLIALLLAACVADCFVVSPSKAVRGADDDSDQAIVDLLAVRAGMGASSKTQQGLDVSDEIFLPGELPANFDFCSVTHSNLGNEGPDSGAQTLHYENVSFVHGVIVDMVVTVNDNNYQAGNNAKNGFKPPFGLINAKCGVDTRITFTFVEHDTLKVVRPERVYMSFFDLDSGATAGVYEEVGFEGMSSYHLTPTTELKMQDTKWGPYWSSTTPGTGADNPKSTTNMTQQQMDRSVTGLFLNQSSISAHIGIQVPNTSTCPDVARNFMFAFRSSLVSDTNTNSADQWTTPITLPQCLQLDFSGAHLVRSNLGGEGPDLEFTRGLVFGNVSMYDGKTLDLAVSVLNSVYTPFNVTRNGLGKGIAYINGACGSQTRMRFQLLDSYDGSPVNVLRLCVSFADLDTGINGACAESVTVGGFQSFHLSENTELDVVDAGGGEKQFVATSTGLGSDNPSSVTDLSPLQQRRTVEFEFAEASEFVATLAWTAPSGEETGRNIVFGGHGK